MAKQLNVNLAVSADTSQAKAQIAELQQSLSSITKMPVQSNLFSDVQLKQASKAAQELQIHLEKAINVNTGKLDLARFSASIKSSERDLSAYMDKLIAIGPAGQKAFLQLANSIAAADAPATKVNRKLQELGTTLKNTARWQISSSILHGFMGSLQSAYGYAQDLNKSLTDIRIVSGKSADEMAIFAEKANKAAKALSTTTTAYTDAALIYYQQGLGDQEIEQRTDVTVKMANVTGEQVDEVSSYMTAIWNNFNKDGEHAVEHYADIMTRLGAATAASTDEIAAGLSKFSAVADTIGLSFEMASSSVTAIIDQTRESPEVVGTALKTIFSRVEGLKQGDTLEDGTDLNKYSEGLSKVGVNIKDANGQLKDMDTILHEIGDVWETLNKDQQIALSQTVAGVRQYNQFMALFDNWGKVEENLTMSGTAAGTLQEQADIYAESWEAASNRVRAAAEDVWDSLLNDKFFIGFLNGVEKVLDGVSGLIDGFGGLGGVFTLLGSIFLRHFAQSMPRVLNDLKQNLMVVTGQAKKEAEKMQQATSDKAKVFSTRADVGQAEKIEAEGIRKVLQMKQEYAKVSKTMTETAKEEYENRIANVEALYKEAAALARKSEELKEENEAQKKLLGQRINSKVDQYQQAENKRTYLQNQLDTAIKDGDAASAEKYKAALEKINAECGELEAELSQVKNLVIGVDGELKKLTPEQMQALTNEAAEQQAKFEKLYTEYYTLNDLIGLIGDQATSWQTLTNEVDEHGTILKEVKQDAKNFVEVIQRMAKDSGVELLDSDLEELKESLTSSEATIESIVQALDKFKDKSSAADKFAKKINEADKELDELRASLLALGGTDEELVALEKRLERIAKLNAESSRNKNQGAGEGNTKPNAVPAMSQTMTEFASAAMGVQSVMTSVTSAVKVFGDEGSSAMDKFGAALSIVTSAAFAFQGVQQLTNVLQSAGIILTATDAATTQVQAASKLAAAGATNVLSVALLKLQASFPPLLVVTILLVAALAALAAGAFLVSKAFQWIQGMTPEGKLKAAEEAAKNAATALESVNAQHEKMKGNLNVYDETSDKLKNVTKGTQEWNDAINESNSAVLELIDQFPELAEHVKNVDGRLTIDPEGRKLIEEKSQSQVTAAQNTRLFADSQKAEADLNVKQNDLRKDIQADANLANGGRGGVIVSDSVMDKAIEAINSQGSGFLSDTAQIQEVLGVSAQVANALKENSQELITLAGEVSANTAAQEIYGEQMAKSYLEDDEDYQNASASQKRMIEELAGDKLNQDTQDLYDSKYKDGKGMTDAEIQKEYAELIGAEASKNKGKNTGEYLIDGKWETISDETARMALAMEEARGGLEGFAETVIKTTNSIRENKDNAGLDLNDDVMETIMGFNGETGEVGDVSQLSKEELDTLGEVQFTEEEAKALGYDTAEKLMTAIDDAIAAEMQKRAEENAVQANAAAQTMSEDVYAASQEKGWTKEQDQAIADAGGTYGLIQSFGGEQALNDFATERGLSVDAILAEIDWSTMDPTDVEAWFKQALEDGADQAEVRDKIESDYAADSQAYGFEEEDYRNLTEHIQDTAEANEELADSMETNEKAAQEVAKDILRYDKALESVNENSEDWYDTMKDGNLQDQAEIMDDVADAMGNMLDMDPSSFSDDFLTNAENIKLMQEAAEGSEEAYEELQKRAQEDIIAQCKLESDFDQAKFDQAKSDLDAALNAADFDDLKIGADIDSSKALAAMTDLVNAAGMTAQEATDYLASMGVDAEVEEVTTDSEENSTYMGATAEVTEEPVTYMNPITNEEVTSSVPSIKYKEEPVEVKGKKQNKATSLKVTSASKSSGGGFKYKNSSHGGGSKGKSGGGGGGGGSKPKKNTGKKKDVKKETDRYHVIKNTIEDLNKELDRLGKAKDRAWGKNKLKLINAEIDKTKEAIKAQEEYKRQIEANLFTYDKNGNRQLNGPDAKAIANYGAQFDEKGNITNYDAIVKAAVDKYNNAVAEFNTKNTDDEAAKKKMEAAEEEYAKFQEILKQYEETHDLWMDEEDKLIELKYQLYDQRLELVTAEVDAMTQVLDNVKELFDYLLDKLEDKSYAAAERLTVVQNDLNRIMEQNEVDRNGIMGILGNHVEEGEITQEQVDAYMRGEQSGIDAVANLDLTEDEINTLEEYHQNLLNNAKDAREAWKEQHEIIRDAIDEYAEGFDKIRTKIENMSDTVEWYGEIVDLVGQKALGVSDELIDKMNRTSMAAAKATLQNSKNALAGIQAAKADAEAKLAEARASGNQTAIDEWSKTVEKLSEDEAEAIKTVQQDALTIMEKAVDTFESNLEKAAKRAGAVMAGQAGSLEDLMDQMERQQELDDLYVEDYKQIYELSKLTRDINKSIDESDNIKAKQELKKLTAEIAEIEASGEQLSEYELEHLRKKYELKVAELALEEAQDAKSQVRMQRDSEGNWGYVYTADTSSVEEAEQTYEDKLFAMQEHTNQYLEEIQFMTVEAEQELFDALQNLRI